MTDLPTRESFKRSGVTLDDVRPVLRDYVRGDLLSRAEWEATIKAVVTVNADDSNDFGWMEYVKGPYAIETTATMLPTGRYGLVKLDAAVGEETDDER